MAIDPITLALIIGGGTAAASKLGGASTSDALKQGVLSGGLSFLPGAQAANPYARAVTNVGTQGMQEGIKSLLLETAKQGAFQRLGRKAGVDPNLTATALTSLTNPFLTGSDPLGIAKRPVIAGDKTVADLELEKIQKTGREAMQKEMGVVDVAKKVADTYEPEDIGGAVDVRSVLEGQPKTSALDKFTGIFKTNDKYDIDKIAKGATLFGIPAALYLSGAFEQKPTTMIQPTYNLNLERLRQERGGLRRIDPVSGEEVVVDMQVSPEQVGRGKPVYEFQEKTFYPKEFNEGGLAAIQHFAEGGVTRLPTKTSHDENDANNYTRVNGYIEDDNGDKDIDTMLAQLADGEFVTRTDGVLGAGIIAGANPKDEKEMRAKGAKFFYDQQARFKRVFDLLNADGSSTVQ